MIAYKRLIGTTSAVTTFDERQIGGTGGEPGFNGFRIDATIGPVTIRLPKISLCEGKAIHFISINPSGRNVVIAVPAGSTDKIVISASETSQVSNTADFGQVYLFCDGARWFALSDASFS